MAEKDTLLSKTASFYDENPETDDGLSVFPISHSKLISKKSEIKHTSPFSFSVRKSLPYLLVHKEKTFQQKLFTLIDAKKMSDVEACKRSNVSKKVFSDIRSNINYQPNKKTAVAFCIGLKLNMKETEDLLRRAGYSLSNSISFDIVIKYCINEKTYDIMRVNELLYEHHLPLIGKLLR